MNFSFREKVQFERRILARVNAACPWKYQLFGLTEPAIARWAYEVDLHPTDQLLVCLRELMQRCRLESDKSRDVFDNSSLIDGGTIEQTWNNLQAALDAYRTENFTQTLGRVIN
jgi:hypothetical protein